MQRIPVLYLKDLEGHSQPLVAFLTWIHIVGSFPAVSCSGYMRNKQQKANKNEDKIINDYLKFNLKFDVDCSPASVQSSFRINGSNQSASKEEEEGKEEVKIW